MGPGEQDKPVTSSLSKQSHEIFADALEREEIDREGFIAEAGGADGALRAEVEGLLGAHLEAGEFLEHPPKLNDEPMSNGESDGTTASEVAPDPIPTRIGHYLVRRLIGSGGMGAVYEAMQEHPHRIVALKVMRHGLASRTAMRRFELESELLARLQHPSIAQVYEAGTYDDGVGPVPYFAMEYVPGARPGTTFAEEQRLSTRDRLGLF